MSVPMPSISPIGIKIARRGAVGLVLAACVALPGRAAPPIADPKLFIETLGGQTVDTLRDSKLTADAKLARLVALLNEATNLALIARLVLGRHWRDANEAQRLEYVRLFEALIVNNMAARLGRYGGESFAITDVRAADERDTVVATRVLRDNSPSWTIEWRVRRENERCAVVDIIVEGVSMVVTQRSEMGDIVAQRGIDGLIASMRERLQRNA